METESLQPLLSALGIALLGIGLGLNKVFKNGEYFKQLLYQWTFDKPLHISLTSHPLFTELQSFMEVEQHYAHFSEQHRNFIFVKYILVFTKALHQNFLAFCQLDLDKEFQSIEEFEAALQSLYNTTFGTCLVELKQQFTFSDDMFFKIQTHQEEDLY